MIKAFSIAFALIGLLSSCSENKDPALIERKRSVFPASNTTQYSHKEESKINHGAISESQISEQSITQHEDVYQDSDHSNKQDEIKEVFDDEYADLSDIENPVKQMKSGNYKTSNPLLDENFIWPVDGEVVSRFGNHNGIPHEGITVSVPEGTKVKAASDGKVAFVGNSELYGNLVIIEHKNNVRTAYAYNSKLLVSKNANVSKGSIIALSGKTGQATSPQLYFATSKNGTTVDPEKAM